MKTFGPTFMDEVLANPILRDRALGVIYTDDKAWLPGNPTPEEQAALDAILAAHDPNKQPIRQKAIKDLLDSLSASETTTLQSKLNAKQLWALLARGEDLVKEDSQKVAQLCAALNLTPADLFSR
jgi:hypothetical protein